MIPVSWLLAAAIAAPVEGRVTERGSGTPVEGAEIHIGADAATPAAVTDEAGRFQIDVADDAGALTIWSTAHRAQTVTYTPDQGTLRIVVDRAAAPAEVVVEAFRPDEHLSRHRVDAEMAYETPGTYDDAFRLVQALPGVAVQREFAPGSGNLAIRGSLPGDNRVFLDGIEIPYLYHFNQYASVFPASQIEDMRLYPSGFGASFGDAAGAVIDATSRTERPRGVHGSAMVNFVTAGADIRAPIGKRWWLSASGRRSFQDLAESPTDQFGLWPQFHDYSVRAERQQADGASTGLFAMGAGDQYTRAVAELDSLDPVEASRTPDLSFRRGFDLVGIRHRTRRVRLVAAVVDDRTDVQLTGAGQQTERRLSVPIRADVQPNPSAPISAAWGTEIRPERVALTTQDAGRYGPLAAREAPAMTWNRDVDAVQHRLRADAYTTVHMRTGALRFMPGLRVGVDSRDRVPTIEPRMAARWRLGEQTEIRAAAGRYLQRPTTRDWIVQPDVPTTSSWQAGVGIDQTLGGRLEISADAYGRALKNVLFQGLSGFPTIVPEARVYGGEVTARYRVRESVFVWAWLTHGRSQFRDAEGLRPTPSDQPWSGGAVVSWNVTDRWNVAVRYRAATGLPYTDIIGSAYDATEDAWDPRPGPELAARLPTYQKLDLHSAYTWRFDRWSLELSGDVWIVPPASAQLYPSWNFDFSQTAWVRGPTILPLLGLRATF